MLLCSSVLYHQTSKHKAKDGGDMGESTIDLRFGRAPLMV